MRVSVRLLRWVMLLLLAAYLLSGIFTVREGEKAFVLVFGKISGRGEERVKRPGIHWTLPRPISEIVRIPTERIQTIETQTFWVESTNPMGPPGMTGPQASLRPGKDGYSLTGDANLIHSRWALRYRVGDPEAYVFKFRDVQSIISRELDHAIVKTSGRFPIDRALRTDIEAFRAAVTTEVTGRIEQLRLGVQILGVEIAALAPPRQVAEAFNAVTSAEQERSSKISEARKYATTATNDAEGRAARFQNEGEAYAARVVSEVSADADYFNKVHAEYVKNPRVIARALLQNTLQRVLAGVDEKFILAASEDGKHELRLELNRIPRSNWLEPGEKR